MTRRGLLALFIAVAAWAAGTAHAALDPANGIYWITLGKAREDGSSLRLELVCIRGRFTRGTAAELAPVLDTAGLRVEGQRVRGDIKVTIELARRKKLACRWTLDAMVEGATVKGKFSGLCGTDAVEGEIAGQLLPPGGTNVACYVGGRGNEAFTCVEALSDGTVLVGGWAENMDWLPKGTKRVELKAEGINNARGTGRDGKGGMMRTPFVVRMTADLQEMMECITLPPGAAEEISVIKMTNEPRKETGRIYLGGATAGEPGTASGTFIAPLDHNFLDGTPTRLVWVKNLATSATRWDLCNDGRVVFIARDHGASVDRVARLKADGTDDVVPDFRRHFTKDGMEFIGSAGDAPNVVRSVMNLRSSDPDLRSWTWDDYTEIVSDGCGYSNVGKWPMDYFYRGPANPQDPAKSYGAPGYTGYTVAGANCGTKAVAVDRRDNHIYVGFNNQSKLPYGMPDFEPGMVAFTDTGRLKYWRRLYRQTLSCSLPDQFFDVMAIDYSGPVTNVICVARSHGNDVYNYFSSRDVPKSQCPDNPGYGFKTGFSGVNGDIHLSWVGKMRSTDGAIQYATYVAEWPDEMKGTGGPSNDPLLDGWPDPNDGWAELNTTRVKNDLRTDEGGRMYLLGVGRRTLTTRNAFQKMYKKSEGTSSWNDFIRVYARRLQTVDYSTILTGKWDPIDGGGGANVQVDGVCPVPAGMIVVGQSKMDRDSGNPAGNPMPTANVPAYGKRSPSGVDGVLALLTFDKTIAR